MSEIKDFVEISKYAGERFDLVQAGGGNSSVKLENGEMLIKASGFLLSDMDENSGYSKVDTKKIASIVKNESIVSEQDKRKRESLTSALVKEATLDTKNRPSIETLLHSFFHKYTLHTHPVVVNMITIQKNYKEILKSIFQDEPIAFVPYQTPGIELALALNVELERVKEIPNIIFLQNHGLIITSPHKHDIERLTEYVLEKIENYLKIDMNRYKLTNKITHLLNSAQKSNNISYLSEDIYLSEQLKQNKELFSQTPFCPDSLVFCGVSVVVIKDLFDIESIESYKKKYFELPKIINYENNLFFIASNVKKAKEMEEVFKFHIMVLDKAGKDNLNFLELEELAYLSNWEAEQYRQKI
jgi:rhamnose utilization protein RhaD (predicted bifunctional aldolase and dehydrogenase)